VGVAGAWGAGALALYALAPGVPTCRFHALTGVPCPTCGGTRAVVAGLRGDVLGAFAANPLLFAALLGLVALLAFRVVTGRSVRLRLARGEGRLAWGVVVGLALADWAYLIAVGR
jgi:hypothetical protein